jgi:hypothetical protein
VNSAQFVSTRSDLFETARSVLLARWAVVRVAEGMVQVEDDGERLFTLREFEGFDWDLYEPPEGLPIDQSKLFACDAECRSDDLFVKIARQIANEVDPLWVIDTNDLVWDAANLDAATFHV